MMYLSKGELTRSRRTGLDYVSHCGCVYALGPELAGLWKKARLRPQPVTEGKEQAVRRLEGSGLVITTEETGTLVADRLLTGCVTFRRGRQTEADRDDLLCRDNSGRYFGDFDGTLACP